MRRSFAVVCGLKLSSAIFALTVGAATVGAVPAFAVAAPAEPDLLQAEVAKLMEIGWKPSVRAAEEAQAQFDRVSGLAPDDARVKYAFALVQLRQRKYPDAARLLAEVLAADKTNAGARRARAWVLVLTKDYGGALVEMENLGKQLAANSATITDKHLREESAAFLGRVFGFLSGPAQASVSDVLLTGTKRRILEKLDPALVKNFEDGFKQVIDQHADLTGQSKTNRQSAIEGEDQRKEALQKDIEEARKRSAKEMVELAANRDKIVSAAKSQIDQLQSQLAPILQDLARLDAQAAVASADYARVNSDFLRFSRLAAREKDPVLRDRYLLEARRSQILQSRIEADLIGLQTAARGLNAQRAPIENQLRQVQGSAQTAVNTIDGRRNSLLAQEKKFDSELRKAQRPSTGDTTKVRALNNEANAFTTYEELPLDAERQLVLESLAIKPLKP